MTGKKLQDRIREIKAERGDDLLILAHHYQRPEIVELADEIGDSFVLARAVKNSKAGRIVLCGVRFMAEGADLLAARQQRVYMPSPEAGCPLADAAAVDDVEFLWERLKEEGLRSPVPVVYINSSVEVKAFCGRHGGAVCTSANAAQVLAWARREGRTILFLPDRHLGRNTWRAMGLPEPEIALWDPRNRSVKGSEFSRAKLILWAGGCHVHEWFTLAHVERAGKMYPQARLVVHPECSPEVVDKAEAAGSTSFIIDFVAKCAPGEIVVIGTEQNLVYRLAAAYDDRRVIELAPSPCPNMMKTTAANLLSLLQDWPEENRVCVSRDAAEDARRAMEKMLEICR